MQIANQSDDVSRCHSFVHEAELGVFDISPFPVWVFDFASSTVVWANRRALELWEASDIGELSGRDMSLNMSCSVRKRLQQYKRGFSQGLFFDEVWTVYPNGIPKTLQCRFRGCIRSSGETAMLCEALQSEVLPAAILRSAQALLYTDAMVSVLDRNGECVYANPAALETYSAVNIGLYDRGLPCDVVELIQTNLLQGTEGRYLSEVMTQNGIRFHEIEVRKSFDAVTGARTLLLTEIDVNDREAAKIKAERLANVDHLTGLCSRSAFTCQAEALVAHAFNEDKAAFVFMLDLDRFKDINDTLGHSVGDQILREIGLRLTEAFENEAVICRMGGDEFCILYVSEKSTTWVSRMCRKIATDLSRPIKIDTYKVQVSISMGISHSRRRENYAGLDDLVSKADLAMYSAKRAVGPSARLYRNKLSKERFRFLKVEEELRDALTLQDDRLSLVYQPIVCSASGIVFSYEALTRMKLSSGEEISPAEFVPIAEQTGLIEELGEWVVNNVAIDAHRLTCQGYNASFSINVSPMQLRDSSLINQLQSILKHGTIDPNRIQIELTESANDFEETEFQSKLRAISELGFSLAIDDFGSAYSNIARLNNYPIDTLKIDKSLVSTQNANLAIGVVALATTLGFRVVAEGVETAEQSEWLSRHGCNLQQGYYWARPKRASDLDPFSVFQTSRKPVRVV